MAIAVEGVIMTKALTGCNGLAGSDLQEGGVPLKHSEVAALFICNVDTPINMLEMCNSIINKLKDRHMWDGKIKQDRHGPILNMA